MIESRLICKYVKRLKFDFVIHPNSFTPKVSLLFRLSGHSKTIIAMFASLSHKWRAEIWRWQGVMTCWCQSITFTWSCIVPYSTVIRFTLHRRCWCWMLNATTRHDAVTFYSLTRCLWANFLQCWLEAAHAAPPCGYWLPTTAKISNVSVGHRLRVDQNVYRVTPASGAPRRAFG